MKRLCALFLAALLAGCSEDKNELPPSAVGICQTAVEMSSGAPETVKFGAAFDASELKEIEAREARIRIPDTVEHVIGLTYSETDAATGHRERKAYCGFKGPKENMEIQHIVVNERELDTFSMDEVVRRYKDKDVTKGERL